MLSKAVLFVTTLLAPIAALAQTTFDPVAWEASRPATSVEVTPGKQVGHYLVRAIVTDLDTQRVIAEPVLVARANEPATFEMGTPKLLLKLVVNIAQDGRSARYVGEIHKAGKIESSHATSLRLGGA